MDGGWSKDIVCIYKDLNLILLLGVRKVMK